VMGWLPTSILPREARFAYLTSSSRLAEIYVPFVLSTEVSIIIVTTDVHSGLGASASYYCAAEAVSFIAIACRSL
jgi:hypothetical protein